ncbi:MAG: prolyl oligopeptidase family serine peptidase [Rhizomicrobium sp.]
MRTLPFLAALGGILLGAATPAGNPADQPPPPRATSYGEALYGARLSDPYRGMEALDPATLDWIKAQGTYTRRVLDAIGPRAALFRRIDDFVARFGAFNSYQREGGRAFFLARPPGAEDFDLMVKDAHGIRTLIDIAALRRAHGGATFAIDYYLASPDGSKVAAGISQGGSEDARLRVYDAQTGAAIAGPIDRAEFGLLAWNDAGTVLTLNRQQALAPGEAVTDKNTGSFVAAWDLKAAPVPIWGGGARGGPAIPSAEVPQIVMPSASPWAVAMSTNGAQTEIALWVAPKATLAGWMPLASHRDGVTAFDVHGDDIYLLSHRNAPTFQVLRLEAGEPLSRATVLLAARPDRIVQSIRAAKDGLYVVALEGVYSHLLRIAWGRSEAREIALPFRGSIAEAFSDPRADGISIAMEGWTVPPGEYAYDPATRTFADLKLAVSPPFDPTQFAVSDLQAEAHDGAIVPLTLLAAKHAHRPGVTILRVYGSYGISELPYFSKATAIFLEMGGRYAVCHARGGGEKGEAWRLAGKDENKPNTWRDLIACAENLVARGVTTRSTLVIWGGSAGGIAVGRAMEERPDLFAGVIDDVPAANMTRSEFSPGGTLEIPEFGSVKTERGFRNLLAMDTYQHVEPGRRYPPILIGMGPNDARIAPWVPAKFAARLMAQGSPVLLRVNRDAGHGVTLTRAQGDNLMADFLAFAFWRAGLPGWRPQLRP